jgi:hypothetical protein
MSETAGEFSTFYRWVILFGLFLFGGFVAFDLGLVSNLLASDNSHISLVIVAASLVASLDAGRRAYRLGIEIRTTLSLAHAMRAGESLFEVDPANNVVLRDPPAKLGYAHDHLLLLANRTAQHRAIGDQSLLIERLENAVGRGHETGWFLADLMVRLGLLGTVIGFIVMLSSVSSVSSIDLPTLQQLLGNMSNGMRIALYTTLTGLVAGILLGLQYRLLDAAVDRLMAEIIEVSEVHATGQLRRLIGNP